MNNYRKNAKDRGLEFEIAAGDFRSITQAACHYCGAYASNEQKPARPRPGAASFLYNGLDRVDNGLGYVPGNVVSCCRQCNWAKRDLAQSDFLQWVRRAAGHGMAREKLAAFGLAVLRLHRNDGEPVDLDGFTLEELAEKAGVIEQRTMTEACGEACQCAYMTDFPARCFFVPDDVSKLMKG